MQYARLVMFMVLKRFSMAITIPRSPVDSSSMVMSERLLDSILRRIWVFVLICCWIRFGVFLSGFLEVFVTCFA